MQKTVNRKVVKNMFKKLLSIVLALSSLTFMLVFPASALTTNCPTCGAECSYYRLPMDPRHECICPNHGAFYEENCETIYANGNCTQNGFCSCGGAKNGSSHQWEPTSIYETYHVLWCRVYGCDSISVATHTFENGFCVYCGYSQ